MREAGHPLVEALCATAGQSAGTLLAARLLDTAAFWAQLAHREHENLPALPEVYTMRLPDTCGAIACATTARGLLTHASGFRQSRSGLEHFHAVVSPPSGSSLPRVPDSRRLKAP